MKKAAAFVILALLAAGLSGCSVVSRLKPAAGERWYTNSYTTGYGWWDNTPPGSAAVCCSAMHRTAGGTGTYADPITVAVDYSSGSTMQFARGTRFYVPNLRAYLITEDRTGTPSATNSRLHGGSNPHLDIWVDGRTSTASSADNCARAITHTGIRVIQNPKANYVVVAGPLAARNRCRPNYGNTALRR